ncbi:thiamine phosphate synthase [Brevibacillus massiliensis]|jgi:thiamine-phosphate pyrophosphorylase|uniref:thiamine phosphate synthase n=1 Tax=Brevibacillus massiliensis TaxID=1118054 RepID=UPI000303ED5E|nr:thiamine phosphate synthase [Brevibacillus massiliensis]
MITKASSLREALKLYFVMGSVNCRRDPVAVLEESLKGGVTFFQFREKGEGALTGPKKAELAKELQKVCKRYGVPFLVNDDLELMETLDADGLHIGQEDGDIRSIRSRISGKILGVSVHNMAEAAEAVQIGADYVGVGPIYPTETKKDTREVAGTCVITKLRSGGISLPMVGIGGIQHGNARAVIESGADGIAVITSISLSDSPYQAAQALQREVNGL